MTAPTEAGAGVADADKTLSWDGDNWRVLQTGRADDQGRIYCHLASTSRGRQQRNGWNPVQICDWIPSAILAGAQP